MPTGNSFYDVLTQAINEIAEHGYDSPERIAYWQDQLRRAAERTMRPQHTIAKMLRDALDGIYRKLVEKQGALRFHPGVARFTLERLRPQLRGELDRRILASADLIRLNRKNAIEKTLQRFAGWSTSIPKGGSSQVNRAETKRRIRKSMRGLPFEERRVLIDQGHKLTAAISQTIAQGGGAIAGTWRSNFRQPGYDYRPDHKERDGEVYALRGNWAMDGGLMKAGPAGYYDQITAVGEEPFCRCYMIWIYNLRDLPDDMLTVKGRRELEAVRLSA